MKNFVTNNPLIKWTGSKRRMSDEILSEVKTHQTSYIEPFLGGGSVAYRAMELDIFNEYILSDTNENLIEIHKQVSEDYKIIYEHYIKNWESLKLNKSHYYHVRDRYNDTKDFKDFHFLLRTSYNGMVRYNSKGEFNSPYHMNRDGIKPDKLNVILEYYHNLTKNKKVLYSVNTYERTIEEFKSKNAFIFIDPPYSNSKSLYNGLIDYNKLVSVLNGVESFTMTFNNINSKDNEYSFDAMGLVYNQKKSINSGNSSFSRLKGNSDIYVSEYLYIK
jgi:DNA adenine methylase